MTMKPSKELLKQWRDKASRTQEPDQVLAELAAAWGAQQSQDGKLNEGFVLVPLVMTRAMEDVVTQEDWQWGELLAAAQAVTEEQYNAALAEEQP